MNQAANYIIELTLTGVLMAWVLLHPAEFNSVVGAGADALVGGVQALWGPSPQAPKKGNA